MAKTKQPKTGMARLLELGARKKGLVTASGGAFARMYKIQRESLGWSVGR
jgi:hypothetical protein